MTLVFLLAGQTITRMDRQPIAAKSINFLRAQFVRGEEWEEEGIITPVFSAGGKSYTPALTPEKTFLDENGICLIPHEALDESGMMTVTAALYVESEQKRVTVNAVCVPVGESGYTEAEESLTPTPDVYEQLMADYQQMVSGLEDVQKNGLFKNDDGEYDAGGSDIVELKPQTIEDFEITGKKAATTGGVFDLVGKGIIPPLQAAQQAAEEAQQTAEAAQQTAEAAQQSFDLFTETGGELNGNYQTDVFKVQEPASTPVYRMYNTRHGSELINVDKYGNIEAAGLSVGVGSNAKAVATQEDLKNADTAAQGYASTAQDNAIKQAAALAQEAQSAAETAAQQYADAARQAAEATAQEYADAAEAAAKAADPTDLLLTDRLLQLGVGGTAIGEGVQLPQEKFELWNDITLESDTTNVTVTQTDDGRPLKIKKLFIFFYGQFSATPGVYVRLGVNNGYMSYTALGGEADTPSNWWLRAEKVGPGFYQSIYAGELSQGANVADATNGYQANIEAPLTDISGPKSSASQRTAKEVNIATYTSLGQQAQIRAGSHIRIYGVMEEDE